MTYIIIGVLIIFGLYWFVTPHKRKYKTNVQIRKQLTEKWGIRDGDMWIPLDDQQSTDQIEYCQYSTFAAKFGTSQLKSILREISSSSVYEINNEGNDRKILVDEIDFAKFECYYTNETADWVVYYSHEDTVTFAGRGLIDKIIGTWTDWDTYRRVW